MRILKGLWFFYQKLIVPSLAVSFVLSLFTMKLIELHAGIRISFIFLTPAFHYFTYELNSPEEYYFYHNLGLGKVTLWVSTIIFSLLIGLTFLIL